MTRHTSPFFTNINYPRSLIPFDIILLTLLFVQRPSGPGPLALPQSQRIGSLSIHLDYDVHDHRHGLNHSKLLGKPAKLLNSFHQHSSLVQPLLCQYPVSKTPALPSNDPTDEYVTCPAISGGRTPVTDQQMLRCFLQLLIQSSLHAEHISSLFRSDGFKCLIIVDARQAESMLHAIDAKTADIH